jgi:hypothetical protein
MIMHFTQIIVCVSVGIRDGAAWLFGFLGENAGNSVVVLAVLVCAVVSLAVFQIPDHGLSVRQDGRIIQFGAKLRNVGLMKYVFISHPAPHEDWLFAWSQPGGDRVSQVVAKNEGFLSGERTYEVESFGADAGSRISCNIPLKSLLVRFATRFIHGSVIGDQLSRRGAAIFENRY